MPYLPGFRIQTKVVGVTYDDRQNVVAQLMIGEQIRLVREPTNSHDTNAIRVERLDGSQFGYINSTLAAELAAGFDQYKAPVDAVVREVVGGFDAYSNLGVNIEFVVPESKAESPADVQNWRLEPDHCTVVRDMEEPGDQIDGTNKNLISTADYPYPYPFDFFNPVQSEVFHHRESSHNIIIAANTSAGKTIAAELLMDATLKKGRRIIYLSPLKSLTEEKYEEWRQRYQDEAITIMTGDYTLSPDRQKELALSRIIVMTSEMMDSRTRKFEAEKNHWMKEVGLVIVDESHILTTRRGDAVETGIMRFTLHCPRARILLLSATMPNVRELGDWLTSLNEKATDLVQSNWRPVTLERHIVEYNNVTKPNGRTDYWPTEFRKIQLAIDLVQSKPDEKFLVFVHSKKTGYTLLKYLRDYNVNARFHNADLDRREREKMETSFKDKENGIRVLVSTSTTAWGVNLPARNVVIVGVHSGLNKVDELDIIQMAGRAGRYKLDDEGHVYQIVPAAEAHFWRNGFDNPRPVTSILNDREKLAFHVLAEIYRKAIKTTYDLFSWYERSLAFRQGRGSFTGFDAKAVLRDLFSKQMIFEKDGRLQVTGLGLTSAVMYFPPHDIYAWYRNFRTTFDNNLEYNDTIVAWAISTIPTFRTFVSKEYKPLAAQWKSIFKGSALYFDDRTVMHLEAAHVCLKREPAEGTVRNKVLEIVSDAERIIAALRMIDTKFGKWSKTGFWDNLESRLVYAGAEMEPPSDNSKRSDCDEDEDWGDADWAAFLGCDRDDWEQHFSDQLC
jgi:late competence protein required for DNA uptake (superfamily II DNA/RNA helicase)